MVDKYFKGAKGNFFIEAGANDGETISNTVFFELKRNWTGILIEPNPEAFQKLLAKNRQIFTLIFFLFLYFNLKLS